MEQQQQRCIVCKKRVPLYLVDIAMCRCKQSLCKKHRFIDMHKCSFDYRETEQGRLKAALVRITPSKLETI